MTNEFNPYKSSPLQEPVLRPAHGLGSILIAGLFGGPIAAAYLVQRDIASLALHDKIKFALAFFVAAISLWLYLFQRTPPDFLSKILMLLPQLLLWWLMARYLLRQGLAQHLSNGGTLRSKWFAFSVGVFVNVLVCLIIYAIAFIKV